MINNNPFRPQFDLVLGLADEYLSYHRLIDPSDYDCSLALHNAAHARRVLIHSAVLSAVNTISYSDRRILFTAAIYHDIGRTTDVADTTHGFRSWIKYRALKNKPYLEDDYSKAVRLLIVGHCLDDERALQLDHGNCNEQYKTLLFLLKDADALDRVRNKKLDTRFLRNQYSPSLVPFATQLYDHEDEFCARVFEKARNQQRERE